MVEQVLESQKSWEVSEVGQSCKPLGELVEKREKLVRGIVRRRGRRRKGEEAPLFLFVFLHNLVVLVF